MVSRFKIWIYALLSVMFMALTGCDTTSVNEIFADAPTITTFTPIEGSVGTEIFISGNDLQDVVGATIGGVPAEIVQKISNTSLIIKVSGEAKSGKISLANAKGTSESASDFSVTYPAPKANDASLVDEVEMGNKVLISGSKMNVILSVLFTANGHTESHEANVIVQNDNEIVVTVPYVEEDEATISFRYFDGSSMQTTTPSKVITVKRYQPNVTTKTFATVTIGDVITLEGTYLNKINSLFLGNAACNITQQTENSLSFVVPPSTDLPDGNNTLPLKMVYFDGVETRTITDNFNVYVPFIYKWFDKKIWGQGRDVEELTSFFSPETGVTYANSSWRDLDPTSYQHQGNTCSTKNVPAVTEAEYNNTVPYFFFSGTSAGLLQINSPAGSNSQLRNFYMINNSADQYRVTGAKSNCYGTPCLAFLPMDPGETSYASVIGKIKNRTLERIDESTFPVNSTAMTVGDINISAVKQSVNNTIFAPDVFSVGSNKSADVDAVIMVIYYNYHGQGTNPAENIRRIGFIHIKHVDYILYNNTKAPSSSSVIFDMYWMKHDYRY